MIHLIRHGQSVTNVTHKKPEIDDYSVPLTDEGKAQALNLGRLYKGKLNDYTIICSPFVRTVQTLELIIRGSQCKNIKYKCDPLLREVDHDYWVPEWQHLCNNTENWFFKRYGCESPADALIRAKLLWNDYEKHNNLLIVGHGMMIRLMIMALLDVDHQTFENFKNPKNCQNIVIYKTRFKESYSLYNNGYGAVGIEYRNPDKVTIMRQKYMEVNNGY